MERDVSQRINRITLKINSIELEDEYRKTSIVDGIHQFRYAYIMGAIFYLIYMIIDYVTYPGVASYFVTIRLALVVPMLLIGLATTYTEIYKIHARAINLFIVMISGLGSILMLILGEADPNITTIYVSLILVLIFLYAFYKMPFLDALFVGTSLVTGFLIIEYFLIMPPQSLFFLHCFNMATANLTGASVAYVMEYQSKKEFLLKKKLSESVVKDALTGLYNRHYFDQFLVSDIEEFIHRSRGVKHIERRLGDIKTAKYGLFMLDIDFFKRINDTFGHHSGDLVLQQFAQILEENVRRSDDVLRVGGEEFLLVLKLTTDDYLVQFMKKIGRVIAEHDFIIEGGGIIGCTVSIGLVVIPNARTDDVKELVRYADRALYRSKDSGRNRGHRVYELQGEMEFEEIIWDE